MPSSLVFPALISSSVALSLLISALKPGVSISFHLTFSLCFRPDSFFPLSLPSAPHCWRQVQGRRSLCWWFTVVLAVCFLCPHPPSLLPSIPRLLRLHSVSPFPALFLGGASCCHLQGRRLPALQEALTGHEAPWKQTSPSHPCSSISKGKVSLVKAGGCLGDPFTPRPTENSFCSFNTPYFGLFCSNINGLFFFSPLLWRQSSFPFCLCGLRSSLQCSSSFILAFCPLFPQTTPVKGDILFSFSCLSISFSLFSFCNLSLSTVSPLLSPFTCATACTSRWVAAPPFLIIGSFESTSALPQTEHRILGKQCSFASSQGFVNK